MSRQQHRQKINEAIDLLARVHSSIYNPGDPALTEPLLAQMEMKLREGALAVMPEPIPDAGLHDGEDRRLECWFCPGQPSVALAPRHSGGDIDVPAHWVPVCERHAEHWHDETDAGEMLPIIPRYGVALSKKQAQVVERWSTTLVEEAERARVEDPEAADWTDADDDALEAIETGLRALHDIADPDPDNNATGDAP